MNTIFRFAATTLLAAAPASAQHINREHYLPTKSASVTSQATTNARRRAVNPQPAPPSHLLATPASHILATSGTPVYVTNDTDKDQNVKYWLESCLNPFTTTIGSHQTRTPTFWKDYRASHSSTPKSS